MSDNNTEIGMRKKEYNIFLSSIKKIFRKALSLFGFKVKVIAISQDTYSETSEAPEVVSVDIPSVSEAIQQKNKDDTSSPTFPKVMTYPTSGGNIIIPNLAIGHRREMGKTSETIMFEYWGNVDNGQEKMDSLTREYYPFALKPQTGLQILRYTPFEGTVNGASEPMLYGKLCHLEEIEPEIQVLKNVSLPIEKRNYGYKPDIVIKWESKSICIDVEIDEAYDILSRKPIHYTDEDCNDYLRNAYFLKNGWYVIRIAEEQVIKEIDKVYNYVSYVIFVLSQDERFKTISNIEPRKRWSREEAQTLAVNNYREEYLEIEPIKATPEPVINTPQEDNKEGYNIPDNCIFTPPYTDIVDNPYSEQSDHLKEEAEKCRYLRIKKSGKGYEFITTKDKINYFFHGIRLFDIVEDKEYYLSFADIDSFESMEEIMIEKEEDLPWHYFMYENIVHCRPIHFIYSKTSENGPTERTVLYLSPYIMLNNTYSSKYLEDHSAKDWLNGVSWHMHKSLCNVNNIPQFTGYCTYRKDIRTFDALRILEGYAFNCYKPWANYDTNDVLEVLEKGDGKLAEIIYSHFTDEDKAKYFNIANNAHALVMQGRLDDAMKLYRTYSKDYVIPDNGTWGDAILADINSYISKDIHKAEFEEMKKLYEE